MIGWHPERNTASRTTPVWQLVIDTFARLLMATMVIVTCGRVAQQLFPRPVAWLAMFSGIVASSRIFTLRSLESVQKPRERNLYVFTDVVIVGMMVWGIVKAVWR